MMLKIFQNKAQLYVSICTYKNNVFIRIYETEKEKDVSPKQCSETLWEPPNNCHLTGWVRVRSLMMLLKGFPGLYPWCSEI